jgi:ATP-dependent RNA helicase RhlE
MKFDDYNLSEPIKKAINELGYNRPTDIQFKSIPSILKGEDVLAIAQTGTGKTAAFAIPVIQNVYDGKKRQRRADGVKCVVMAPTRELANQISEEFIQIAKNTNVKVMALTGGVEQDPQIKKLQDGIDIVVATPGRTFDLASQGYLRLNRVNTLILDEADHMLDLGFYKDIQDLTDRLPGKRQTLFFSATINKEIKKLAYSLVRNAIRIQVSPKDPVSKNVTHGVAFMEMDDKRFFLEKYLKEEEPGKTVVFVRTKVRAERVLAAMARVGIETNTIHGDKDQSERTKVMNDFKSSEGGVLITTDVAARGIDIPNVNCVINYDLPTEKAENYVHRIGRTGRGNKKGLAISFCAPDEREILKDIEELVGYEIERLFVSKAEYNQTIDTDLAPLSDLDKLMKEVNDFEEYKPKKKKKNK